MQVLLWASGWLRRCMLCPAQLCTLWKPPRRVTNRWGAMHLFQAHDLVVAYMCAGHHCAADKGPLSCSGEGTAH